MKTLKRGLLYISFIFILAAFMSGSVFAARAPEKIEVFKVGDKSLTLKWSPYTGGTVDKYTISYKIYGGPTYTTEDILPQGIEYSALNSEFTKTIFIGMDTGTIYDIKLDVYINGNGTPVAFYTPIYAMTKIKLATDIDSSLVKNGYALSDPANYDKVGHLDFSFYAPKIFGGTINAADIDGYQLMVSQTEGQVYTGTPYEVLYSGGQYEIYKSSTGNQPLTYNSTQFTFNLQNKGAGKDFLAFSLYENNQPTAQPATDDFKLATVYHVLIKPKFNTSGPYKDVEFDGTVHYDTIEALATILPVDVQQVADDLIQLDFQTVKDGNNSNNSMVYSIEMGKLQNSLTLIHTEYDSAASGRTSIQYYNKITPPATGTTDDYYYKVTTSNGVSSRVIKFTATTDPDAAPIMQNIKVEKVIADTVTKTADIILSWDTPKNEVPGFKYRLYMNTDPLNQVEKNDVIYDSQTGQVSLDSNGKIRLNTKKDINGNNILFKGLPVVYERIAEIDASDLSFGSQGSIYKGPGGDTLVDNFLKMQNNYFAVIRDGKEISRTIYKISGLDLTANPEAPNPPGHMVYKTNENPPKELETDYKTKIELNTTYYLKMDSVSGTQISDYSLGTSFTTPNDVVTTVPVPDNFNVNLIETDKIGLEWDKINPSLYDDGDVTYEVFVSENNGYNDSDFYLLKNPTITMVSGKKHLLLDTYMFEDNIQKQVQPNKVYLFRIRAMWKTKDANSNPVDVYSNLSAILPVTTKRTPVSDPDMTTPKSPVDFVLKDVTSKQASFQWTKVDDFSTYRIVRTSQMIDGFAPLSVTGNGVTAGFTLSGEVYSYSDASLTANTLYYFSIRSEVNALVNGTPTVLVSQWITVPVTTTLAEAPTELTLVSRSADGHSVTISWKGKASLNYETAKKDDSMTAYQMSETVGGDPLDITMKTFQLTLNNLKSNTKYMVKVRAKDPASSSYSKFIEPIEIRTEFNQTDYNKDQDDKEKTQVISDVAQDWLKSPMEKIGADSTRLDIWVKSQKASEEVKNSSDTNYTVDLSISSTAKNKAVFIPVDLVSTLNTSKDNLEVKTPDSKLYIKPNLLDVEKLGDMLSSTTVKSRVIKLQVDELPSSDADKLIYSGEFAASKPSELSIKVLGYNKTEAELNKQINDKIASILSEQKALVGSKTMEQLRADLDYKIKDEVKKLIDASYVTESPLTLSTNKIRFVYSFNVDETGKSNRYVAYIRNGKDTKEVQGEIVDDGKVQFETATLGKVIIVGKSGPSDISGIDAESDIKTLVSKYDFTKEIVENKFRPNAIAKRDEVVSFIVDVLAPQGKSYDGLSAVDKAKKLGILDGFPTWEMSETATRQELAYLISKAYEAKTGINPEEVVASRNIIIADEASINEKYKKSVYQVLDNKFMISSADNLFFPEKSVTRAEVATALANMLRKLGEIK